MEYIYDYVEKIPVCQLCQKAETAQHPLPVSTELVSSLIYYMLQAEPHFERLWSSLHIPLPNWNGLPQKQCLPPSATPRSSVVQLSKKHNAKINNAWALLTIYFSTFRCVSTSHNPQMFKIFSQILACRRLCPVMRFTSQMGVNKQRTPSPNCLQAEMEWGGGGSSRESNITVCLLHTKGD